MFIVVSPEELAAGRGSSDWRLAANRPIPGRWYRRALRPHEPGLSFQTNSLIVDAGDNQPSFLHKGRSLYQQPLYQL